VPCYLSLALTKRPILFPFSPFSSEEFTEDILLTKRIFCTGMKKIIKNTLLTIILMPIALLLLGIITYYIYALLAVGGESTINQSYLNKHKQVIELGSEGSFSLFDSAFYQKQIFMLSEVHGFAVPQELDFMLLKHLNKTIGLHYYMAEVDHSQAYFLNQYLKTGNEDFLRYVFQTWIDANAQWGNKNYYDKIIKIYELNKLLSEEQKISFIGVDKIQDIAVTNRYIRDKFEAIKYQSGQSTYLDSLKEYTLTNTIKLPVYGAFAERLIAVMGKDTSCKHILVKEHFNLMHVLTNIAYYAQPTRRDSVMYLNLQSLTKKYSLEDEKMYGLWGYGHTLPYSVKNGVQPFAALISEEGSIFRGKLVAINIFAVDSENLVPTSGMPEWIPKPDTAKQNKPYITTTWVNSDGPLAFVNGIKDLKAESRENTATMFKMDGDSSPYKTSDLLTKTKVLIPGQTIIPDKVETTITEAFPYVILIRNSPAAKPL
jgi:hypothetical protein